MSTPLPSLSLLTQHFFAQDAMHEMSPPCSSPFLSSSRVFCRMKRVCACVCTYVCMCVCVSASSEEMEEKEERGDKDKRGGGYSAFSFPSLLLSFSFSLFHTHTHTYIHTHIHTHARALLLVLVPCPSPPSHPIVSALLCSALSLCLFLTGSSAARTHSLTHAYLSSTHTHTQTHTHTHTHTACNQDTGSSEDCQCSGTVVRCDFLQLSTVISFLPEETTGAPLLMRTKSKSSA